MTDVTPYSFRVSWLLGDDEWVATCDQLPSLSFLHHDPVEAMEGIYSLVADYVDDTSNDLEPTP